MRIPVDWVLVLSPSAATAQSMNITVQVFDGRNGKPLPDQHVQVFTGISSYAVKIMRSARRDD